jgi:hypothetical protein
MIAPKLATHSSDSTARGYYVFACESPQIWQVDEGKTDGRRAINWWDEVQIQNWRSSEGERQPADRDNVFPVPQRSGIFKDRRGSSFIDLHHDHSVPSPLYTLDSYVPFVYNYNHDVYSDQFLSQRSHVASSQQER